MKSLITIILIASLHLCGYAQKATISRWSASLEVLTQTTGIYTESYRIPGIKTQLAGGKGLQAGVEYIYVAKKQGQWFQNTAALQYGSRTETGFGVMTALGYRRRIGNAFVEGQVGAGYLQTKFRQSREMQNDAGEFFSEKFKVSGLTPTVAVGAGYNAGKNWKIYLRYYHHAQLGGELVPGGVRLHRALNLGAAYKF